VEAIEPAVAVVIPTRGSSTLGRCLASLRAQTFADFETVVVHDGDPEHPLGDLGGSVRVRQLDRTHGFAGAVNAGAEDARGSYLAVLNDDVELDAAWLDAVVGCLQRHPAAASVATKVLLRDDPSTLDGAGDCMTLSLKAYRRGQGDRDRGQFDEEEQVFSASGTACLWRLDVFRELGGFDDDFFAYYEDVDLGFRARLAGYECWYAPAAVAVHVGSATFGAAWSEAESLHAVRNRWTAIIKNAPPAWIARNAHRIAAAELVSLVRAVHRRELRLMLRAYGAVGRSLRSSLHKRRAAGPLRRSTYAALREVVTETFPPVRTSLWRLRRAKQFSGTGS
jgi:GT2 family glycosyltransferase